MADRIKNGFEKVVTSRVTLWILIAILVAIIIVPIYWLIITAMSPLELRGKFPLPMYLVYYSLHNFEFVFVEGLLDHLTNSVIVALGTAVFCTTIGSLAAYSFAKVSFPFKYVFLFLPLLSRMVPDVGIVVPVTTIFLRANLGDTYFGLVLAHSLLALPIVIWIMTGLFQEVPNDLLDAARTDGCTRFQAFYRIALPLVTPGLSTSLIFCFLISWDELLYAIHLMSTKLTVPAYLDHYITYPQYPYVMAVSVFLLIPAFIFTFVFQRYIRAGMMAGAVKG